jgi:tRNA A-37 threonylcarbamoyl transferase component Bud32
MELIGKGLQANVYLENNKAIKLFNNNISEDAIKYEMNIQDKIFKTGLPVPEVYEIVQINNKMGFSMEYIQGVSFFDLMINDLNNIQKYLTETIELQIEVNSKIINNIPLMSEKFNKKIIKLNNLEAEFKNDIINTINSMEYQSNLCHGDFHVKNIIKTKAGNKIIDWVDSTSGNKFADICKTYFLYKSSEYSELCQIYITLYNKITKEPIEKILEWEKIIATLRFSELGNNITNNEEKIINKTIGEKTVKPAQTEPNKVVYASSLLQPERL